MHRGAVAVNRNISGDGSRGTEPLPPPQPSPDAGAVTPDVPGEVLEWGPGIAVG